MQELSLKVVLDGQSSPLVSPMLEFLSFGVTLVPVFINDLPDVVSRIGIDADDTTLSSSLGKSVLKSAGEFELDLRSIVEWGDEMAYDIQCH